MKYASWLRRFLPDGLTIRVQGTCPERFLSQCVAAGIRFARLSPFPGGFTARIPAWQYRYLYAPARQCDVQVRIQKRRGPGFRLARLWRRPGLLLGLLLFAFIVRGAENLLWATRYVEIPEPLRPQLREQLAGCGLYPGAWVTEPLVRQAERAILEQTETYGWLGLNFAKGRLVVEQLPAEIKPEEPTLWDCNLVAAADALVLRTDVASGFLLCTKGQTVAKGDVLIGKNRLDRSRNLLTQKTMGTVTGLVQKNYSCTQPLKCQKPMLTGLLWQSREILFMGKCRQLPGPKPPSGLVAGKTQTCGLQLLGLALPLSIRTRFWAQKTVQTVQLNPKTAEQMARLACREKLYKDYPDAIIRQEKWEINQNKEEYICNLEVLLEANIAKPEE